jgi:Zn-dependent peptidase ImmA (M78 family)
MPKVNPELLRWARETAGLPLEEAARKISLNSTRTSTSVERLESLEAGTTQPSVSLLRRMAKQYRRPLVSLYLSKAPERGDRGEDFRTLPDAEGKSNPIVEALLRDIKARQDMVKVLLRDEEGSAPLPFISAMQIRGGVEAVVSSIVRVLKFDLVKFRSAATVNLAFNYLRDLAEENGIFVLLAGNLGSHHTTIDVRIFRGFALADSIAPFVVINDQDAKSAWTFTLLHELAHLWLGQSGITGEFNESKVEQFCSQVASQILLPDLAQINLLDRTAADKINIISQFAAECRVSASMVAYRLYLEGALAKSEWQGISALFRTRWLENRERERERAKETEGGPNYYVVRRHRVGSALIQLVQRNISTGSLTPTKAGKVLGVKPRSVAPLLGASDRTPRAA